MRRYFCSVFAIGLIAALTSAAPQTQSLAGLAIKTNPEQALKAYRNDLQAERADLLGKNLTLTPGETTTLQLAGNGSTFNMLGLGSPKR